MNLKRALVSVSDKTGLLEFIQPFVQKGLQVVSTGGTLKYLRENQIQAQDISELTGFPEVLDGRVKTLHPRVHMGLLGRKELPSHVQQMNEHQVEFFDMVIGNLYPFEKVATAAHAEFEELIENIDIGGPSFLRSSAKNYKNVIVVSDPQDYNWVQKLILENKLADSDRKKLAMKVFSLTSYYDAMIVQKLSTESDEVPYLNLPLRKKQTLRYGENAHQKANWYYNPLAANNWSKAEIIQGKELSYNNLLDLESAYRLVSLYHQPGVVAVKHNNPCGSAMASTLNEAMEKTIQADPKSIFGGIIAFNRTVDMKTLNLLKNIFVECLVAPDYSAEVLEHVAVKKNVRVLKMPLLQPDAAENQFKSIAGSVLLQNEDSFARAEKWTSIGQTPSDSMMETIEFGEKVCAFLKSNAIALVYKNQTVGLGMGQVNRVDSVQLALQRMEEFAKVHSIDKTQVVAVSDAFFPFADSLELFSKHGVQWIVQPGGSVKDSEVIDYATQNGMNMVLTGVRHFRH